jgi:hypothetical protein
MCLALITVFGSARFGVRMWRAALAPAVDNKRLRWAVLAPTLLVGAVLSASQSPVFFGRSELAARFAICAAAVLSADYVARRWRTQQTRAAPAAAITFFLAGSALLDWRHIGLTAGTQSLFQMAASVVSASLHDPNPYLLNPPIYRFLTVWGWVPFLALALAAIVYGGLAFSKKRWSSVDSAWPAQCAVFFGSVLALTVAGHRLLYRFFHIPMPVGRTAVFLAPVATMFVGSIAAIPGAGRLQRISRKVLAISLSAVAGYYICCLRATYFQEWRFNAGSAPLYRFLASYKQGHQLQNISANWRYVAVLNYYRVEAGGDTIPEVPGGPAEVDSYPSGKDAYVIYYDWDRGFVGRENLRIVYRDEDTGVAVAVPRAAGAVGPAPAGLACAGRFD